MVVAGGEGDVPLVARGRVGASDSVGTRYRRAHFETGTSGRASARVRQRQQAMGTERELDAAQLRSTSDVQSAAISIPSHDERLDPEVKSLPACGQYWVHGIERNSIIRSAARRLGVT